MKTKEEIKNELMKALDNSTYQSGIAEIVCDIVSVGKRYENESILVMLWGYGNDDSVCDDDLILMNNHWHIVEGIDNFDIDVLTKEDILDVNGFCAWYVENFKEIKPFISDFL